MSDSRAAVEPHPDLSYEQGRIDHAYACLEAMRARAVHLKSLGYLGGNVHSDTGLTPEMAAYWDIGRQLRVDALSETGSALCFGRIDRLSGERWYIGRRHVEDADANTVVADWRAPVATPFYRATVPDPMGLRQRRRFLVEGRHLVDVFDEDLEHPSARDAGAYVPDPLLAEINLSRTGEMRDIVATIQAEQDVIIRAPLDRCIVVQGGPGTGKTAVGLHRAAFLLYEHREMLERQRLLVVGPNRIFLRYISQVLPSLGETASVQLTLDGLAGARYRLGLEDSPAAAKLKGDSRMAEVLRRATFDRVAVPATDFTVTTGFGDVILAAQALRQIVSTALSRGQKANDARATVREQLVALAWRVQASKHTSDIGQQAEFETDLRTQPGFKAVLDKLWPSLSAAAVLRRLYSNSGTRARATRSVLGDNERNLLARKSSGPVSKERWTRADLALLDEIQDLIGGTTQTYGHIVIDEAQDLSAMELRMIARRSRRGSMTILGDLAQATAPAAQASWESVVTVLTGGRAGESLGAGEPGEALRGRRQSVQLEELTVGYRVPAPIMELANRLLPRIAPDLPPTTSVRDTGDPPQVVSVPPDLLLDSVAAATEELTKEWASLAVVVPHSLKEPLAGTLRRRGVGYVDGEVQLALGDHVTLLAPESTKGLEFDAVIVVEPGRIVAEAPAQSGESLLYVVLTRAVQHLTVLHGEPLPAALL
ncbi:MAG: HelD family protein [Acidimicrobiales bacterium]